MQWEQSGKGAVSCTDLFMRCVTKYLFLLSTFHEFNVFNVQILNLSTAFQQAQFKVYAVSADVPWFGNGCARLSPAALHRYFRA